MQRSSTSPNTLWRLKTMLINLLRTLSLLTPLCSGFEDTSDWTPSAYTYYPADIPPCITNKSELVYVNGAISVMGTFLKCLKNIPDPMLIPNLYNGKLTHQLVVNTSLTLNNLHSIDPVQGSVTLDCYLWLGWNDPRISMPLFWDQIDPAIFFFDLISLLQDGVLALWLPDIRYYDLVQVEYLAQYLSFSRKNLVWQRHILITLKQPLNLHQYPFDTHSVYIRYGSVSYHRQYMTMGFSSIPLIYNTNFDGSYTLFNNPIWSYHYATYELYTTRGLYVNAIYHIHFSRQGSGIVTRLVLPITLLLALAALTFWASEGNRVDSTITLLLSVSALYIVILDNIPLLGYLTSIDKYVFWMFFLLVAVVSLHQIYSTLLSKQDKWPLRVVACRLIECFGRVFLVPFIVSFYIFRIEQLPTSVLVPLLLFVSFIGYREFYGLIKVFQLTLENLVAKANRPDCKLVDFSRAEIIVLNYLLFQKLSLQFQDLADHLASKGELSMPTSRDSSPSLRDVQEIKERERNSSVAHTGVGIQLVVTPASSRRKYGHDSDDDEEEAEASCANKYGAGKEDFRGTQSLYRDTNNVITSPVHRL